jgi:hypothetical protein
MATGFTKKCPYCAQMIPLEALVCHLCRRDVDTPEGVIALKDQALKDQKNQYTRKVIGILAIILFILWAASNKTPTDSNMVDPTAAPATPQTNTAAQTDIPLRDRSRRGTPTVTLPFYDVDALVAKCAEQAPQHGEGLKSACKLLPILEKQVHDELAKHWDSHDSSIRLQCIATKQVVDSTSLRNCIE